MRRPARVLSGLLLGALLLTVACKKTVENQTARWTAANKTADELGAVYPGFKAALEDQRARAKAVYDSASSITDEKDVEVARVTATWIIGPQTKR